MLLSNPNAEKECSAVSHKWQSLRRRITNRIKEESIRDHPFSAPQESKSGRLPLDAMAAVLI